MPTETIISSLKKKPFKGLDKIGKFNYHSTAWRKKASLHKKLNPICQMCNRNPVHTTDHKKPLNQGGLDEWDNLQSLCKGCNARKTSKDGRVLIKEGGSI